MMIRVIKTSEKGAQILYEEGEWFIETGQGITSLNLSSNLMGVLPLLERSYLDVYDDIWKVLEGHEISPDLADTFPATALISFALLKGSAYWKEQALGWLEDISVSEEIIVALESICKDRLWPQALRHKIRRCLSGLRKRAKEKKD